MTLAYLTTPLLGLVDTAIIGRFGDASLLGGLAAGAMVFNVVFTTFNFLRSSTTGLVAQAFGRHDATEERAVFWRAFVIAAMSGLALVALTPLIVTIGKWFIGAEPGVTAAMENYIRIRLVSAPAALINYAMLGYFLGRGEAGRGLFLQLVLNGLNIGLSNFLGLYLGWGVAGVAWAAVCGEAAAMIAGMAILLGRFRAMPKMSRQPVFNVAEMSRMLHLSSDIMIRCFVMMGAYIVFTRQGAQLGTLVLAANAVLMQLYLVTAYFLDGFGAAAEQLVGRAIGASYRPAFFRAVRLTAGWGLGFAGCASVLLLASGEQLVGIIARAVDVRTEAVSYLPWAAFAVLSGAPAFQMEGIFIGATWSRDIRNTMLLAFAAFVAAVFRLGEMYGNHGLWAALHIFLLVRGTSLLSIMGRRVRTAFRE
ncbi:MATE family efflux transporter [Mesorhizobium sp. M1A.F.Ca.ET.072.01.1.1]|nr:MATE family efflux transporter [Mesorhizobium sp. M1A.F.Ca.ET.072.01.1.1]TIV04032.1 MAG: MATE family efflux transporter [Mesorhizobium sp.]